MAVSKFLAPLNGQNYIEQPYVDDIFDPLFNAEVRNYYNSIYGNNPLGRTAGILSGYGQMWENALTGKKGILGPGMGILGTFGRSMDKADDFILGGLTEGVNLIGSGLQGSNDPASNPFKNIFVEDQDYSGTRLLAAMGNAMAGLTGNQGVKLDESNFNTLGDKIAGIGLDLATDPGIAGSQLARLNPGTPVGEMGSFLNEYDDIMGNIAGNMALPGLKNSLSKSLHFINDKLSANSSANLTNTKMGNGFVIDSTPTNTKFTGNTKTYTTNKMNTTLATDEVLSDMADEMIKKYNINPVDNPELYKVYEEIKSKVPTKYQPIVENPEELEAHILERAKNTLESSKELDAITEDYTKKLYQNLSEGVDKHPDWFSPNLKSVDLDYDWASLPKETKAAIAEELYGMPYNEASKFVDDSEGPALIDDYDEPEFVTEDLDEAQFGPNGEQIISTIVKDDYGNNIVKNVTNKYKSQILKEANENSWKYTYNKTPVKFAHSKAQLMSQTGKQQLDIIYNTLENFLEKHPEGLSQTYLRNELGIKKIPESVSDAIDTLYKTANPLEYWHKSKSGKPWFGYDNIDTKKLANVLNSFKETKLNNGEVIENGLIPWIRKNEDALQNTRVGKDLIQLADTLDQQIFLKTNNIFDVNNGEVFSLTREINSTFNGDKLFKDVNGKWLPDDVIKSNLETFAKDFNYFELSMPKDVFESLERKLKTGEVLNDNETYAKYINQYYKPAREYPYKYQTFKVRDIQKELMLTKANSRKTLDNVLTQASKQAAQLDSSEFTKYVTTPTSNQIVKTNELCEALFEPFKTSYGLSNVPPEDLEKYIRKWGTPEDKRLFAYFNAATENAVGIKVGARSGTLQIPMVKRVVDKIKQLTKQYNPKQVRRYLELSDSRQANIVKGNEMLTHILEDGKGLVEVPIDSTNKLAMEQYNQLKKTLISNVNKINSAAGDNIIILIDTQKGTTKHLGYCLNFDNNRIFDLFKKAQKTELQDMVFKPGVAIDMPKEFSELENAFEDARSAYSSLATKMNLPESDISAIKHVGTDSPEAVKYWEDYINNELGLKSTLNPKMNVQDTLENMTRELQKTYLPKGRFGTINYKRFTLGNMAMYGDNYSDDLNLIVSSTFTKGVFDNTNTQTFAGMFLSDNFAVNKNFATVEDLKNAFFTKDGSKLTGNIANTELVAPRYNELGNLIGLKKYNKTNMADLEKAFKDDTCILVPDFTVDTLDKVCKNEAKMDNKIVSFINKYFTTPFKLGTLANPGFIVGNIEDAYFKQAVEFSRKYGTSFADEASNVAMSMRKVVILNNQFEDKCMNPLREFLSTSEAAKNPIYRKWTSDKVAVTPALISGNPEARKMFTDFVNNGPLDVESRKIASLYLYLSGYQDITLNKFNKLAGGTVPVTGKGALKDADTELQNVLGKTEFSSKTPINRALYGAPNAKGQFENFFDQGLINNWYSKGILDTSNDIETMMRSASVINELEHKGHDLSEISDILTAGDKELRDKLRIDMVQAINTMNSANFNYDKASEFLNKASYILPFPTFYLKNMAYWADIFVNKPQIIDNTISVHEGLWSGKSTKDEFVAEAKGRGAVPVGQQFKHLTGIAKQSPYNSMFGAFNAFNNPQEDVAYRINPIARPVTRHLQNPEDVKYRPYTTNQYEKNIKQDDPQFSNLAYMFHQLNPYERFMNTYLRTPGKIAKNNWQVSDILPSVFQPDFKK